MATKTYICRTVPNLGIGADIRFNRGVFTTDREFLQRTIERNEWFNRRIFMVEMPIAEAPVASFDEPVAGGSEVSGDVFDSLTEVAPVQESKPQDEPLKLKATDINHMKVDEARELAATLGIEDFEDWSGSKLKREIKFKLEL